MYAQHWGLSTWPFENRLETRRFVTTPTHGEALARLQFLIEEQRRFGVLAGPAGTGKSLLLKVLAEQSRRTQRHVALVDLAGVDAYEMAWQLAAALRIAPQISDSLWRLWMRLNDFLSGQESTAGQTVLLFDHAETAEQGCLRQLERLAHRDARPSGQSTVIVAGHGDQLVRNWPAGKEMASLWVPLARLDAEETRIYVRGLLSKAGCTNPLFDADSFDALFEETHGIPRDLNRLCELSLIAAFNEGQATASANIVRSLVRELRPAADVPHRRAAHVFA